MVFFSRWGGFKGDPEEWISRNPWAKVLTVFGVVRLHFAVIPDGVKALGVLVISKDHLEKCPVGGMSGRVAGGSIEGICEVIKPQQLEISQGTAASNSNAGHCQFLRRGKRGS